MSPEFEENELKSHLDAVMKPEQLFRLRNDFARDGFIKVPFLFKEAVRQAVRDEVFALLKEHAERRDLLLATTGNTPRHMSVVRSEFIAANGKLIPKLAKSPVLLKALSQISQTEVVASVSTDEEYLITKQEKKGDTHGWHWGDYQFALIWIIVTPPVSMGGMLQCVPHTWWDKANPQIHDFLSNNQISTYSFIDGDIYFLRTDTTLHRTVPLTADATRVILNMTWADREAGSRSLAGNDRWWENKDAEAARAVSKGV